MKRIIYFLAITTALIALTISMPRFMLMAMPDKALAEKGNIKFLLKTAYDYMQGTNGVQQDKQEAMKWFMKAAEQGDGNAQGVIGTAYYQGLDGYPKDTKEGMKWLRKSANGGNKIAQDLVGRIDKSMDQALMEWKKAADQGDVAAQLNLARFFGKSEDWEQSTNWYGRAAINGNIEAQRTMGGSYIFGRGVPKNSTVAYMWFSLADEQTTDETKKVATIPDAMTKEQAEEFKRIAKERIKYLQNPENKLEDSVAHNLLLGSKLSKALAPSAKVEIKNYASAQVEEQKDSHYSITQEQILTLIQSEQSIEQFILQIVQPIRQYGVDKQYLTKENIIKLQETQRSVRRASQVQNIIVADINGDGKVTEAEAKEHFTNKMHNYGSGSQNDGIERLVQNITRFDSNHDGVVDFDEMRALDTSNDARVYYNDNERLLKLMGLDPNNDGKLTVAELESISRETFSDVDKNSDGIISGEEYQLIQAQIANAISKRDLRMEGETAQSKCNLPKASEKGKVLLYNVYEGAAISTISVAGQDLQTKVAKVTIEQGDEPIYLILSTYGSVVWQIEGSTDRVERAVLISQEQVRESTLPSSAITGIDKSKVVFAPAGSCFRYFSDKKNPELIEQAAINIKAVVGKNVDGVFLQYAANDILLPSGEFINNVTVPKMPNGFDKSVWDRAIMLNSYGIASVKAQDIVAVGKVESYEIFPNLFGVSQLLGQGALEKLSDGKYKIAKPISRYPAGLYGGFSVNFVLGKGIPQPKGDAGHSCVISEETGKPIGQAMTCSN